MVAVIPRPPLPPGPYLVVGLARSGVAAALALRERGAEVAGVDSGHVPAEAVERLRAARRGGPCAGRTASTCWTARAA